MRLLNNQQPASKAASEAELAEARTDRLDPFNSEVVYAHGRSLMCGNGRPAFSFLVHDPGQYEWLQRADRYSAAMVFILGRLDIQGDLICAVRPKKLTTQLSVKTALSALTARLAPRLLEAWLQGRFRVARNIRLHYDRSNNFYRSFCMAALGFCV